MSRYQILYDGENILGDIEVTGYEYYNATLEEQINASGTLTFSVLPTNPALSSVKLKKSTIRLFGTRGEMWRGRIIRMETDVYNRRVITCEGALSWLNDVVVSGNDFDPSGETPHNILDYYLDAYNTYVPADRQIWLGNDEPTEIFYGQLDKTKHYTIFEILSELLANSGGYYTLRFNGNDVYLDYLNFKSTPSGQEIYFGDNLFDIARTIDVGNVASELFAEDAAGHSVLITNAAIESSFGYSRAYHYFNDCNDAVELAILAQDWFDANCLSEASMSIAALDLNLTDVTVAPFYVGQPVHISSPPHGIDTTMILTGLLTDISNPAASQITLGAIQRGLTSYVAYTGGGSGNSNRDGTKSITPSITKTAGNSTLAVTEARKYGKVVQIGFYISITGNVAEGENIWSGTLSDYLPVAYISTAAYYGVATPSAGVFRITAAGDMNFRLVKGALSNGASLYCGLTYITEG